MLADAISMSLLGSAVKPQEPDSRGEVESISDTANVHYDHGDPLPFPVLKTKSLLSTAWRSASSLTATHRYHPCVRGLEAEVQGVLRELGLREFDREMHAFPYRRIEAPAMM